MIPMRQRPVPTSWRFTSRASPSPSRVSMRTQRTTFLSALGTTAKYVVLCVLIETLLGLGLALLVNRQLVGTGLWRIGIILPMTVAPVVVGVMWRLIYASDIGIADP